MKTKFKPNIARPQSARGRGSRSSPRTRRDANSETLQQQSPLLHEKSVEDTAKGLTRSLSNDSVTQEEHSDVPPSPQQPGAMDTPPSPEDDGQPNIMSPGQNRTSCSRLRRVNGRPGHMEDRPTPTPRGEEQPMSPHGKEQSISTAQREERPKSPQEPMLATRGDDLLAPPQEQPLPATRGDDLLTSPQGGEQPIPTSTGEERPALAEEQPTPPSAGKKQVSGRRRSSTGSSSSVGDEVGVSQGRNRKRPRGTRSRKATPTDPDQGVPPHSKRPRGSTSSARRGSNTSVSPQPGGQDDGTTPHSKRPRGSTSSARRGSNTSVSPQPGGQDDGTTPHSKRASSSASSATPRVREAPNRSTMTMQELIYYNPTANPMSTKMDDVRKKEEPKPNPLVPAIPDVSLSASRGAEGRVGGAGDGGATEDPGKGEEEEEGDGGRLVPQLRIGSDGNIIIDEESMLMETTHQRDLPGTISEITEGSGHTTSASYRNRHKVTKWNKEETSKFFRALSQVGTDFTMMTLLLPSRTRKELKNKFKKEERINPSLITQALNNQQTKTQKP